jgi:hypothetical protein
MPRSRLAPTFLVSIVAAFALPSHASDLDDWLQPILEGSVALDMRARYEYADIRRGPRESNASTLRTRLGYGTKPWRGLSGYFEVENVVAADRRAYFDGTRPPGSRSVVADPQTTEVNQAYLLLARDDFGRSSAKVGRQRIVFDDARFIGNVGWRQNEQTYDAALAGTALGVDGLTLQYGYLLEVHRIFGNEGGPATRDFDSNSHLLRAAYDVAPWFQPVAFAYLLDLRDSPTNSSNTFGLRASGQVPLDEGWSVAYQASYAYQIDGGTSGGRNPQDYHAHYALADVALGYAKLGTLGAGYELLGSHDGKAVFTTPLATAHAFNGWADAFLDNGGPNGLQDAYAYVAPRLPWSLQGKLVYHHFFSDARSRDLGYEIDAQLSRRFGRYVTLLTKVAWYDGRGPGSASPADRIRYWVEATFAF